MNRLEQREVLVKIFDSLKLKVTEGLKLKDSGYSHLQNYLFFTTYPVFNFAESIIILCNNKKYSSAKVLLRSLVEAHINILYHQLEDIELKLALSAKGQFDEKIKKVKQLKLLIDKYPNLYKGESGTLFDKKELERMEVHANIQREAILKGNPNLNPLLKDPDLFRKTVICDEASLKDIEPGYFQRMYRIQYAYLSPVAHLDIQGLDYFVSSGNNGTNEFVDEEADSMVLTTTIEISCALVKDLFEHKVFKGDMFPEIAQLIEPLKNY